MKLLEKHYTSSRGECSDTYQTLHVVMEAGEKGREYLKFTLMEQRWRSKKEAIAYLKWVITELETLYG